MLTRWLRTKPKKKIYFLNDTMRSHAGSKAVMRSLEHQLREHTIIARHCVGSMEYDAVALDACDIVFVNGEGTLHHGAVRGRFLMDVLNTAQNKGKITFLVNAVMQEEPPYYSEVLQRLDFFSVREPFSFENAKTNGGNPLLLLDSAADPYFLRPGKVLHKLPDLVKGYTHVHSPCAGLLDDATAVRFGLLDEQLYHFNDIISTLKTTKLYITGQHHAIYAAGFAKIPFIAVPSNSHKIESLLAWSKVPIPFYDGSGSLEEAIAFAQNNPKIYDDFERFLRSQPIFQKHHLDDVLSKA